MRMTTNPFRQPILQMFMKYMAIVVFTLFFKSAWATTEAYDSIGVEEVGDKVFILHKVEMTETLYSVSRRYNVSIYKIIENNPPTEFGLEVGQIIKIPYQVKTVVPKKPNQTTISSQSESGVLTHEVAMKETLYSISKQYGATVEEIKRWNDLQSNSIDVGQQLIVEKNTTQAGSQTSQINVIGIGNQEKTHVVEQSETLYSLSKRYDVPVASIMKWNDLTSPEISIGQKLIVGKTRLRDQKDTVAVETSSVVKSDSIKLTTANNNTIDSTLNVSQASVKDERMNNPVTSSTDFEEVVESGVASLIEGSEGTRKYLALHRTAKVGTIMRVHNEMNGQEVFVRVLGKLPDTGINKNVVIRISKSAYDRLGAIDPSFRVTVSYIP